VAAGFPPFSSFPPPLFPHHLQRFRAQTLRQLGASAAVSGVTRPCRPCFFPFFSLSLSFPFFFPFLQISSRLEKLLQHHLCLFRSRAPPQSPFPLLPFFFSSELTTPARYEEFSSRSPPNPASYITGYAAVWIFFLPLSPPFPPSFFFFSFSQGHRKEFMRRNRYRGGRSGMYSLLFSSFSFPPLFPFFFFFLSGGGGDVLGRVRLRSGR